MIRRLLLVLPALLIVFACAKTEEQGNSLDVKLPIELEEGASVSNFQTALLADYRNGTAIDVKRWHEAIAHRHSATEYDSILKNIEDLVPATNDIVAVKPAYEKELMEWRSKKIRYDKSVVNLKDVLEIADLQCYSGTLLHTMISDRMDVGANRVVIFESGHILAGFLRQVNGVWHLYGIETTAAGKALVKYGAFAPLAKKIRVVDINLFRVVEAFKFVLENGKDVANLALNTTGKFYGATEIMQLETDPIRTDDLNYSPFAFGVSNPAPGPQERSEFDEKERLETTFIDGGGSNLRGEESAFPFFMVPEYPTIDRTALMMELRRMLQDESLEGIDIDDEFQIDTGKGQIVPAAEFYFKSLNTPSREGEIDPNRLIKIRLFIDRYAPRRTGERRFLGDPFQSGSFPGSGDEAYYK